MSHQYDEAEVLEIIDSGEDDAESLLLAEIPAARRKFRALDKQLRAYLAEVRKAFPDACYYTGSGGFNLLLGAPHDARCNGQQQLVALSGAAQISDGDW